MRQQRLSEHEAALATPELALRRDQRRVGVPGAVDDDRAPVGVAVVGVEPDQPHRRPVRAPIIIAGAIGTARAGEAAGRVREILEPAVVLRSEERRVGKECVGTCYSWGSPYR